MTPAETSFQDIMLWVLAFSSIVSFGTNVWTIFSGPAKRNAAHLIELATKVGAHDAEVQRLRDTVDKLPGSEAMHRLEMSMARMEGHIDKIDERLKPVAAIATRMQDLLIERGK